MVYYNILGIFIIRGVGGSLLGGGDYSRVYKLDSKLGFTAYVALDINIWAVPKIGGAT